MSKAINMLFSNKVAVVNAGIAAFADASREQGAESVHVEWKPPAAGSERLIAILNKLKKL
ncbi:MAG: fdrA domain protein [Clostridiales bacterium]|nr:fdrA domain protein [Clostridiales bacterium]